MNYQLGKFIFWFFLEDRMKFLFLPIKLQMNVLYNYINISNT